jgi:hypothetical protein
MRKRKKVYNFRNIMTDEELAIKISKDKEQHPSEFSCLDKMCGAVDNKTILRETSGKTIDLIKKWF